MSRKKEIIYSVFVLIFFVGSIVFLYLSFVNKSQSNLFLILALVCVAIGNFMNFINWLIKRKKKKEEVKENK